LTLVVDEVPDVRPLEVQVFGFLRELLEDVSRLTIELHHSGRWLTVFALEYLNVCALALADGLLVGAVDFEEVFGTFAL
jgi:hypothetical protein